MISSEKNIEEMTPVEIADEIRELTKKKHSDTIKNQIDINKWNIRINQLKNQLSSFINPNR